MRKALLIAGIVLVVLGVIALLLAAFFLWMHNSVLDGSNTLYQRLATQRNVSFVIGMVLSVIGIICFIVRGIVK
ncbi:MAG: hypothetical protein MJ084_04945 [Saccharofermentans sp.]|nr:hypothetical protein [Saccharofermentans sp.]